MRGSRMTLACGMTPCDHYAMIRRILVWGASAVALVAVIIVVIAIVNHGGTDNALAIWGFVLAIVSVLLGIFALLPVSRNNVSRGDVQVNSSEHGDVYGSMNGNQYFNQAGRSKSGTHED